MLWLIIKDVVTNGATLVFLFIADLGFCMLLFGTYCLLYIVDVVLLKV